MDDAGPAPAPFIKRIEATLNTLFLGVILGLIVAVLLIAIFQVEHFLGVRGWTPRQIKRLAGLVSFMIPVFLLALNGAHHKATYGMRSRGLKFVTGEGIEISYFRAFIRIIAGVLLVPVTPISIALAFLGDRGRTLADQLCGTMVIMSKQETSHSLLSPSASLSVLSGKTKKN